jgi:PAS domain S-box-containing protein
MAPTLPELDRHLPAHVQALAGLGTWEWDLAGRELHTSGSLRELLRLPGNPKQQPYRDVMSAIHPGDRERLVHEAQLILETGRPYTTEARVRIGDADVRHVVSLVELITDDAGRPMRLRGIAQDVTEYRRAHEALRDSEERFRRIVETANEGVCVIDAEHRISFANDRLIEMLGADPVGRVVWDCLEADMREVVVERARHRAVGMKETYDLRIPHADGSTLWVIVSASPLRDRADRSAGTLAMVVDITERKAMEEQLRTSETQLKDSDRLRRLLVAHLVHAQEQERRRIALDVHDDSLQALEAVGLRLQVLEAKLDDADQVETARQARDTVREATTRLRDLLFRLAPPALEREGLVAALKACLAHLDEAGSIEHHLHSDLRIEPPFEVRATLYRIALEALANIAKHAGAKRVDVQLAERGGGVAMRIADDGQGVGELVQPPGHMGFATMEERARLAGGECRVSRAPAGGCVVECWLPMALPGPDQESSER